MTVPSDDRGFTLGDGLFETVLAVEGRLVLWDEHMARLRRGCRTLGLPEPDPDMCLAACADGVRKMGGRVAVRLSWSAGSGGRGLDRPGRLEPRLTTQLSAISLIEAPLSLRTSSIRRNETSPTSKLKTLAYLDNVLARRQAHADGADEALMLNTRGELACASAANLFWVQGQRLFTPALDCGVLDGVMRGALLAQAAQAGWETVEVRSPPDALAQAEAVFLTNSLMGLRAVSALDGRPCGGGDIAAFGALIARCFS